MSNSNLAPKNLSLNEIHVGFKELCNVVPLSWYKTITTKNGKPDLNAITILSEIFYWYRPKSIVNPESPERVLINKFPGELWQTSYRHFEEKFTYNHQKIRRALVRLEKLGLIERIITNVKLKGQKYTNVLFIKLNIKAFNKIVSAKFQLADSNNKSQKDSVEPVPSQDSVSSENVAPSLQECRDHMNSNITKQDSKSRSNESNFVESNSEGKGEDTVETQVLKTVEVAESSQIVTSQTVVPNLADRIKAKFISRKRESIAELTAITEEEAYALRTSSRREFSLDYINKLKERLAKKYPEHGFYTRDLFLAYLQKALTNELRQESVVNNEGFRFRANDDESRMQNYLRTVEEGRGTSKQTQLRKKIAVCFDTNTAYRLLTLWTYNNEIHDNNFLFRTSETVSLSANQEATLLDLIRSVYSDQVDKIEFITISKPVISQPGATLALNLGIEGSLWNKVSSKLLDYHGEGAHKSWFSKLQAMENEKMKVITLKAPTNFIKDWIITHYKVVIERFCKEENYSLGDVFV